MGKIEVIDKQLDDMDRELNTIYSWLIYAQEPKRTQLEGRASDLKQQQQDLTDRRSKLMFKRIKGQIS